STGRKWTAGNAWISRSMCGPGRKGASLVLVAAAGGPFELIVVPGEEDVEARQRSVAARDVSLQLQLDVFRQLGRIDVLLERPQAIAQHDDLVEEGVDRPALFLEARLPGPQDERAIAPFLGGRDGWQTGFF